MSSSVRPKLSLDDARAALAWYADVLGAEVGDVHDDGPTVVHADVVVHGSHLSVKSADDADPSYTSLGVPGVLLELVTDTPDAVEQAMLAADAESVFPVGDQPYGARAGRVRDPFGVQWLLTTPVTP